MLPAPSVSLLRFACLLGLVAVCGLATAPASAAGEQVAICHAPPGEPDQRSALYVSPAAAEQHLERHDDTLLGDELCDGRDNDCDGRVDEPFGSLGSACLVGLGECVAGGQVECDPADPSGTRCSAEPLPPREPGRELTCTGGLDEDCDGLIDADDPDCGFDPGRQLPSPVDLPVAIDCCEVSGPGCPLRDYCTTVSEPVNPCTTRSGELLSCLEFHVVPGQNACWTVLDDQSPAVNTPYMIDILENAPVTAAAMPVFVDNGDKSAFFSRMRELMLGEGRYLGHPAGTDRYPWAPGIDSWVVRLPLVECQDDGNHCVGGSPQQLVGALCFEIREIEVFPVRVVRGRFLCPDGASPADRELFEQCELGPDFVD